MLTMETGPVISGAVGIKSPSCKANTYLALVKCPALVLINPESMRWLVLILLSLQIRGLRFLKAKGLVQGLWPARKQQSQDLNPGLSDSKPHVPTGL